LILDLKWIPDPGKFKRRTLHFVHSIVVHQQLDTLFHLVLRDKQEDNYNFFASQKDIFSRMFAYAWMVYFHICKGLKNMLFLILIHRTSMLNQLIPHHCLIHLPSLEWLFHIDMLALVSMSHYIISSDSVICKDIFVAFSTTCSSLQMVRHSDCFFQANKWDW